MAHSGISAPNRSWCCDFLGRSDWKQDLTMDVHIGFVHLSVSKLTAYIARYGSQTTKFWLSRDFETTGNIPKQLEVSVKKSFFSHRLSAQEAASSCRYHIRSVGSCFTLHPAPSPNSPSFIPEARGEDPPPENRQGEAPSGCSWLHTKIFHGLKSCSHSRSVQKWGCKPQSGLANHGLEKASSF